MPTMLVALALSLPLVAQDTDSWLDLFQRAERAQAADDLEGTERWFRAALEVDPENATVAYHMAGAFARAGQVELAFTWLASAVEWGWRDDAVMKWDPDLERLREDYRWLKLVTRAGREEEVEVATVTHRTDVNTSRALLSPDRMRLVTVNSGSWFGRSDDTLLWDIGSGELIAALSASDVLFDPSTGDLASGWMRWDGRTGERLGAGVDLWRIPKPQRFGFDRTLLDAGPGRSLERARPASLIDIESGNTLRSWATGIGWGSYYDQVADRLVVCGDYDESVEVVDPRSGDIEATTHLGGVHADVRFGVVAATALVQTDDDRLLTVDLRSGRATDSRPHTKKWWSSVPVRMLELDTEETLAPLQAAGRMTAAAWSPSGEVMASAHDDATVRLWNVATREPVSTLQHEFVVRELAFDSTGTRLAAGGEDPGVEVWSEAGESWTHERRFLDTYNSEIVRFLAWTANGDLLVNGLWPRIVRFNGATGELRWAYYLDFSRGSEIQAVPDEEDTRIYVSGSGNTVILNAQEGTLLYDFWDDDLEFDSLVGSADDEALIANDDGLVVIDDRTFEVRYSRKEYPGGGWLLTLPNGLFSGTRGAISAAYAIYEDNPETLVELAPNLYDPKRVAAAAAGVRVRAPSVP